MIFTIKIFIGSSLKFLSLNNVWDKPAQPPLPSELFQKVDEFIGQFTLSINKMWIDFSIEGDGIQLRNKEARGGFYRPGKIEIVNC